MTIAKKELGKGTMEVRDFGAVHLHAYQTNDPLADECFLVEKNGEAFIIESVAFTNNVKELEKYIADERLKFVGNVIAYHGAGATFMKGSSVYSTKRADAYNHNGGGAALVKNFVGAFGDIFDSEIHTTTNFITAGDFTLAGIKMKVVETQDAFGIEIPEINAVYTHMLGHDVHSIVAGAAHADAVVAALELYIAQGIDLILTSHYTIENLNDVKTKIAYIKDLKAIAVKNTDAASFKRAVKARYPKYSGLNYLDMSAGMFYPAN